MDAQNVDHRCLHYHPGVVVSIEPSPLPFPRHYHWFPSRLETLRREQARTTRARRTSATLATHHDADTDDRADIVDTMHHTATNVTRVANDDGDIDIGKD